MPIECPALIVTLPTGARAGARRLRRLRRPDDDLVSASGPDGRRFDYAYGAGHQRRTACSRAAARRSTPALTRDDDGLVTGYGPFTFTRSPGPPGEAADSRQGQPPRTVAPSAARRREGSRAAPTSASRPSSTLDVRPGPRAGSRASGRRPRTTVRLRRRRAPARGQHADGRPSSRTPTTPAATARSRSSAARRPSRRATARTTGSPTAAWPLHARRGGLPRPPAGRTRSSTALAASSCRPTVGGTTVSYAYDGMGRRRPAPSA